MSFLIFTLSFHHVFILRTRFARSSLFAKKKSFSFLIFIRPSAHGLILPQTDYPFYRLQQNLSGLVTTILLRYL